MDYLPHGRSRLWAAVRNHAVRAARRGLPPTVLHLRHRHGLGIVLLGLRAGLFLGLLGVAPAAAFQGTTTGEPLNLYLPEDDSDDWGAQVRSDFTEIRSTVNALAVSTGTNAASITAEAATRAAADSSEAAARLAQDLLIGASTASLQSQLTAEIQSVASSTAAVAVSTTANGVAISTTGAAVRDLYNVKLSTGVGIDPGLIKLSTVTTALALKANIFTGISSSCASGFHLSTTTVSNGVITGGSCVADGSGGGGLSAIPIASGTVVGNSTGTFSPQQTVTNLYLDSAGMTYQVMGSTAIIGVKNITAMATATSFPGGTVATSVLSVCLPNSTATWNGGNNPALLCYAGSGNTSATVDGEAAILLDGIIVSSVSSRAAIAQANLSQCVVTSVLSAGSHNACLSAATNDGSSMVVPGASSSKSGSKLSVVEINTGGSGYSVPASSTVVWGVGTYSSNSQPTCISSGSLTTRGGPLAINLMGYALSATSNMVAANVLIDGAFVDNFSKQNSMLRYFTTNTAAAQQGEITANYVTTTTYSAGTHNFCVTIDAPAANGSFICSGNGGNSGPCEVQVSEVRNAAGTGDVSSNGNNNFSGQNTFNGPTTIASPTLNSTATYAAMAVNAEWTPIASTHVWSAASQFEFYNIISTVPAGCANVYPQYKLSINALAAGASGNFAVRFSTGPGVTFDASAANYVYAALVEGAGNGNTVGTDSTMCTLAYPAGTFRSGNPISGDFFFGPKPGNDHAVRGVYVGNSSASADVAQINGVAMTGCDWGHTTNIGPVYGMRFLNTAGTFTGDFTLYLKCGR